MLQPSFSQKLFRLGHSTVTLTQNTGFPEHLPIVDILKELLRLFYRLKQGRTRYAIEPAAYRTEIAMSIERKTN